MVQVPVNRIRHARRRRDLQQVREKSSVQPTRARLCHDVPEHADGGVRNPFQPRVVLPPRHSFCEHLLEAAHLHARAHQVQRVGHRHGRGRRNHPARKHHRDARFLVQLLVLERVVVAQQRVHAQVDSRVGDDPQRARPQPPVQGAHALLERHLLQAVDHPVVLFRRRQRQPRFGDLERVDDRARQRPGQAAREEALHRGRVVSVARDHFFQKVEEQKLERRLRRDLHAVRAVAAKVVVHRTTAVDVRERLQKAARLHAALHDQLRALDRGGHGPGRRPRDHPAHQLPHHLVQVPRDVRDRQVPRHSAFRRRVVAVGILLEVIEHGGRRNVRREEAAVSELREGQLAAVLGLRNGKNQPDLVVRSRLPDEREQLAKLLRRELALRVLRRGGYAARELSLIMLGCSCLICRVDGASLPTSRGRSRGGSRSWNCSGRRSTTGR
mmetsp:Transcript_28963/g.73215  ORF Transcript_28963/g.73215 Transcript_28963/m.73215 type:complete len:441 (+) Transcript_28963:306-1628(+)